MKNKIRTSILVLIPLTLAIVGVILADGTTDRVITGWTFLLGIFEGAFIYRLATADDLDEPS